jgi:hypothetical protein
VATGATARYRLLLPFAAGSAVSVALGIYGRVHDPTGHALFTLFFTRTLNLKAWFATVALVLALVQVLTALRIYGKIKVPAQAPAWLGDFHRLSGTLAFLFSLPVAFHCLWSLGFNAHAAQTRVFVHSVLGCFFYGAFAAKMVIVRSKQMPDWALPVAGGAVFTALVVIWLTSSLWFFTNVGFPAV